MAFNEYLYRFVFLSLLFCLVKTTTSKDESKITHAEKMTNSLQNNYTATTIHTTNLTSQPTTLATTQPTTQPVTNATTPPKTKSTTARPTTAQQTTVPSKTNQTTPAYNQTTTQPINQTTTQPINQTTLQPSTYSTTTVSPSAHSKDCKTCEDELDSEKHYKWVAVAFDIIFAILLIIMTILYLRQRKMYREMEGDGSLSRLI